MAENFFDILKLECISLRKIKDFSMAKSLIEEYSRFSSHMIYKERGQSF